MSYNESLLPNSNYPPMTQSQWDNAPFNEAEVPEKDFDVLVSQTLSKSASVTTKDYIPEFEDGILYADTSETDWDEVYRKEHYTPLELIELFKEHLRKELEDTSLTEREKYRIRNLIAECMGWLEDELIVMKN